MFVTFSFVTRGHDFNTKMSLWPSIKRAVYAKIEFPKDCWNLRVFFFLSHWESTVCQWLNWNDLLIKILFYQFRFRFFVFLFTFSHFLCECKTFLQMQSEHLRKENEKMKIRKFHQKVSFKLNLIFIFVKIHVEFPFGVRLACLISCLLH